MDARPRARDRMIMIGKNHGERVDETATVFERPARLKPATNGSENPNRTSSIFEWPSQRQAANSHVDKLKRTSMIFERPTREHGGEVPAAPPVPAVGKLEPDRGTLPLSTVAEPELIGRTLASKYTIERVIGTGSMGTIYRARQIALDKPVSIKILHRELAEQRTFVERFKLEAFSASRLEHPNSLRVLDFGADGDLLYLAMEYVEADDLLNVMHGEWPFEDMRIAEIMAQALAALAKAHEVGIVHRDIKPENILILRGTDDEGNAIDVVKVCDFGIAKMAGASASHSRSFAPHLTTQGLVVGTPDYMSPEQARGEGVDGRSDLYSMGVVLYHLLAGRPPFFADTPFGVAIQHVSEAPAPPSRHRAVHPALESICLRALSKRPEDRFQTAREMRRAILDAMASDTASATAPADAGSAAPPEPQPQPSAEPIAPPIASPIALGWSDWLRHPNAIWRHPNAMLIVATLVAIATLALAAVISLLRDQDSSWGNENVVRATTIALTPAPPAKAAGDTPAAASASEVRARPAPSPPPVLLR
jgi:serine/threonine protein kinase